MSKFILTEENYHSQEANKRFMSVSQYKSFLDCEDRTMAEINGLYKRPTSKGLIEGSFIHSWSEGPEAFQIFKENTDELYDGRKKERSLKKGFVELEEILHELEKDSSIMQVLEGEKEQIVKAKLFGVDWKAKIDIYNPTKGYIVDLKYIYDLFRSFYKQVGDQFLTTNFVEFYGYDLQMVLYTELEKIKNKRETPLTPYILAISKDVIPIKILIHGFLDGREAILESVKKNLERIIQVKAGNIEPKSCGQCEYCLQKKGLRAFHYKSIPIK